MEAVWQEILEQIRSISGGIAASVNPPADASELRLLEETTEITLPQAFRGYLSVMNGQRNTEEGTRDRNAETPLLGYYVFLSAAGILETWRMMNGLFASETEPVGWVQEDRIKPYIWRRHWLPFAECEGSQYLILDCDPGKHGICGQVFLWSSGMDFQSVTAGSFDEFSRGLRSRLTEGRFALTELGTIEFEDYYV